MLAMIFVIACILSKSVSVSAVLITEPFNPGVLAVLALTAPHNFYNIGGGNFLKQFHRCQNSAVSTKPNIRTFTAFVFFDMAYCRLALDILHQLTLGIPRQMYVVLLKYPVSTVNAFHIAVPWMLVSCQ